MSYDDGTNATLLLQPYLDAMSSTTSNNQHAVQRAIISKALQDPELFCGYNQMKEVLLRGTAAAAPTGVDPKILKTLDLFSYGTISDYHKEEQCFMVLTEPQLVKLRQLTALSVIENLCRNHQNVVPYAAIHQATMAAENLTPAVSDYNSKQLLLRETEQILAPLIASRIVSGKLSQKQEALLLGIGNKLSAAVSDGVGTPQTSNDNLYDSSAATNTNTSSTLSSLLVVQSRDVSLDAIPSMLQSSQRMRTQLNESNQVIQERQMQVSQALENEHNGLYGSPPPSYTTKMMPQQLRSEFMDYTKDDLMEGDGYMGNQYDFQQQSRAAVFTAKRNRDGFSGTSSNY
jgi:hypothetical protein